MQAARHIVLLESHGHICHNKLAVVANAIIQLPQGARGESLLADAQTLVNDIFRAQLALVCLHHLLVNQSIHFVTARAHDQTLLEEMLSDFFFVFLTLEQLVASQLQVLNLNIFKLFEHTGRWSHLHKKCVRLDHVQSLVNVLDGKVVRLHICAK